MEGIDDFEFSIEGIEETNDTFEMDFSDDNVADAGNGPAFETTDNDDKVKEKVDPMSTFDVTFKTGTTGKIFGSVTTVQVSKAIREQKGYEIDRRRIQLLDDIKELGSFKAKVDFGNGNETEISLEIVAE